MEAKCCPNVIHIKLTRQFWIVPFSTSSITQGKCVGKVYKDVDMAFVPYNGLRIRTNQDLIAVKQIEYSIEEQAVIAICTPIKIVCQIPEWTMTKSAQQKAKVISSGWNIMEWKKE